MAQETKVNPWELVVTKVGIMSSSVPNNRYSVPFLDLILTLRWALVGESVFLHALKLGLAMCYHMIKPPILCDLILKVYIPFLGII
jgi:hypothetical protein